MCNDDSCDLRHCRGCGIHIFSDREVFYCDECLNISDCCHNTMIPNNETGYAWRCADCGHVYGKN